MKLVNPNSQAMFMARARPAKPRPPGLGRRPRATAARGTAAAKPTSVRLVMIRSASQAGRIATSPARVSGPAQLGIGCQLDRVDVAKRRGRIERPEQDLGIVNVRRRVLRHKPRDGPDRGQGRSQRRPESPRPIFLDAEIDRNGGGGTPASTCREGTFVTPGTPGPIPRFSLPTGSATEIISCRAQKANPDRSASCGRPRLGGVPRKTDRSGHRCVTTGLTTALSGFGRSR